MIRVTAGLNSSGQYNLCSLAQILLCKFYATPEGNTANEVCVLLAISFESTINCDSISCNCSRILSGAM